jgi:hypothetical protein
VQGIPRPEADLPTARDWPSLSQLATKMGLGEKALGSRSSREDWPGQRKSFQDSLREKEDALLLKRLADMRVRSRVSFANAANTGASKIVGMLNIGRGLGARDLRSLMGALRAAQQVSEVAQGRPADGPQVVQADWTLFHQGPSGPVLDVFAEEDAAVSDLGGVVARNGGS